MLSIKNKLYNETIIVTDLKIQDNTTPAFYLTIDSDSNSTIYNADHTLTIDTKNTSPTLEIAANLTIESTSLINQDLTTDAAVSFGSLSLTTDLAVAHGGTGVGSSTGTVAVVLSNSPTLVSPVLGAATGTSLSVTAGMTVNSGGASGEVGINFTSTNSTFSTIAQSDAEGIGNSSDTRIGLDPTMRTLIICEREDIGTDFGFTAQTYPSIFLVHPSLSAALRINATGITGMTGTNSLALNFSGRGLTNTLQADVSEGNVASYVSTANRELTDDDGQQAWMYIEPKVLQTNTAAFDGLYLNVNGTVTDTYGDGSSGDGNNLLRLADNGTTKFKTDLYGYTKSGTTSGSLADNATFDTTIPDSWTGIVIVQNVTDITSGVYHLDGTTLNVINQNAAFTTSQSTNDKINVYINSNVIRVENTWAAAKIVKVMFVGT